MWLTHEGFLNVVRQSWYLPTVGGGMRSLSFKLKRLKSALRTWNSQSFGNIFDAVSQAEQRVAQAERDFDSSPSPYTRETLSREQAHLLLQLQREEIYWQQKARIKWAKKGDANTQFFHSTVKDKHRR